MRWASSSFEMQSDQKSEDFKQLFKMEGMSGWALLGINNIVDDMRQNSYEFTQRIIEAENRHVLLELIDIALRPEYFTKHSAKSLDKQITYNAIELLTNLSEEFTDAIFRAEGKVQHQIEQDEVLQEDNNEEIKGQLPVLKHMLNVLSEEKPITETALAYLSRLITPYLYQKPDEVIIDLSKIVRQIVSDECTLNSLLMHFYSRSVSEVVTKIMEVQNQKQFFEKQKLLIIKKLAITLQGQTDQFFLEDSLQNFSSLLENLLQKYEDKFERSKFTIFVKEVLNQKAIFSFVLSILEQPSKNKDIKVQCLIIMDGYLKFNASQKVSSKLSDNNSQNSVSQFKLNPEIIALFTTYFLNQDITQFISAKKMELVYYYKVVKSLIMAQPSLIPLLVNSSFVKNTFLAMKGNPNNDILHNLQKEIIVEAINKQQLSAYQLLLRQENEFLPLLKGNCGDRNSNNCFENQLFHIATALIRKTSQKSIANPVIDLLKPNIDKKAIFYQTLIGGNPRTNYSEHWDDIEAEVVSLPFSITGNFAQSFQSNQQDNNNNNAQADNNNHGIAAVNSSTREEKLAKLYELIHTPSQINAESDDEEGILQDNNHYIDCELPLDSDKSIEEEFSRQSPPIPNISAQINLSKEEKQQEETMFSPNYFRYYLQFSLDSILSEVQ